MTPSTLTLLRQCALYAVPMRSSDPRWEDAHWLISHGIIHIEWTMRGGYVGLRAVASC
jgi:hypothetical protein